MKINVIAVDFDGTLCKNKYPKVGRLCSEGIEILKKFRKNGGEVILWTCRYGKALQDAIDACREAGLEFDAVNKNAPKHRMRWASVTGDTELSRKVYADIYIDDREAHLCGEPVDWNKISDLLSRSGCY